MPGVCRRFRLEDEALKVPHIGWNTVHVTGEHPVLSHLRPGDEFYFVNSAAVRRPGLITEVSQVFGSQAVVLSMDVLQVEPTAEIPSGYEIVINGGRTRMGLDAIQWGVYGEELGAGELVINSIDADGTKEGYELTLTREIAESVSIPVIASRGAGRPGHLFEVLTEGKADAALVASMLHYGEYTIGEIKSYLPDKGVKIRRPVELLCEPPNANR